MRFFASVPAHVNDQHVLRFERLFISRACLPPTHKRLFVAVNVIGVNMANEFILREKLETATSPMAIRFEENSAVIFSVCRVGQDRLTARAAIVVAARSKVVGIFGMESVFPAAAAEAVRLLSAVKVAHVIGTLVT